VKLHLFRQDLQDLQDYFDSVSTHPGYSACQNVVF